MCLVSGGGIRDAADAQCLLNAGCQHVLVASAIHDCRFTPDDVAKLAALSAKLPGLSRTLSGLLGF